MTISTNAIQEKIKIATEWLRIYFVLLLADVSGTIALAIRIFKEQSTAAEIIAVVLGFITFFVFSSQMYLINKKINNLINQLNHSN